ncbi:MAG: glycosyltransferase family A protein, partial [Candidatus Binatia bacterium]
FYNEERYLPRLFDSLRTQSVEDIPVVFIDNASTDSSAALVQQCEEVQTGQWTCLEQRQVGKFSAMWTGTAFCVERLGVRYVGFLDADSYCADSNWVSNGARIVEDANCQFGYTYSPIAYCGFEHLPTFMTAYRAYEQVLRFVVEQVGWLANGLGFVCAAEVLMRYFQSAQITTEIDLRCSLLALSEGRQAYCNSTLLMTSGRRITVNARNFAAWCFYERAFYTQKDINARVKLDLNASANVEDLRPDMIGQFFQRRAVKVTCRHLIPLAIFDRSSLALERIKAVLGIDVTKQLDPLVKRFRGDPDFLLTDRFETMIRAIECHPASAALSNRIADLMRKQRDGVAPHGT